MKGVSTKFIEASIASQSFATFNLLFFGIDYKKEAGEFSD